MAEKLTSGIIMSTLEALYEKATCHNLPVIESSKTLGDYYLKNNKDDKSEAIDSLIR